MNPKLRYIGYLGAMAAFAYIALLAVLYILQDRFIYFPSKTLGSTPHDSGLRYEAITFKSADGVDLSGWFIPGNEKNPVVLFCHGNSGNMSHRLGIVKLYNRLQLSTFIFDYRGYGNSDGTPSEEGTYLDAEAAWNYLVNKRKISPAGIVIVGESLGGAVAAWLASRHDPGALVLESTFTSLPEVASDLYPYLPVKMLLRFKYAACEYVEEVKCPVLVVHSCDDEVVPYHQGCQLYEKISGRKEFLELRGSHNNGALNSAESYTKGISDFISRYIRVNSSDASALLQD